ncbi:benzoate 1,2-dioxygenase electron transfer component BenC [Prauserella muralis]|uniref:Oxidoreductase n=1 Tax=Prauserella muralis TaxID=588067 RepID=A0A2V4B307_9PSEU|nr:benzoate 1,2-dioxygenase electron transfer component BenC [Prauserella muralis]PXY22855.1 oxidoreductase [Prauserella muralis]TWE28609.1 NAD(P)H-flavin reductase [Prauserella muralis]
MAYQVALSFEDGVTRFIDCEADQTVADASYRQRVNIPLDCRDGACGTCKAFCESGTYDGGTYLDDALTAAEAGRGYVLPCSMTPKSDLVLRIAGTSAAAKTSAATYPATITALERLSPTTVALTLETPDRDTLAFLPGQYVNIEVPGTGQSRSYSFSNAPDDKELTFLVKLTPGGVMSDYLTERARPGDALTFTGPRGSFFLREADRPALLLAGGTGLAPILSIVRAMRDSRPTRPVHLVYGVTTDDDLVELGTLAELAATVDGLTWDYCVADPASTAPNTGYVTSLVGDEHLHDGDVAVYVCGPPPMVEAVREHLAGAGVEPAGLYYEKFAVSGTAAGPVAGEAATDPEPAGAPVASGPAPVTHPPEPTATEAVVAPGGAGRVLAGQAIFPPVPLAPLRRAAPPAEDGTTKRAIAGQELLPARDDIAPLAARRPTFVSPGRFDGKVVVVTGAAQGIGERVARRISAEGGTVVLADRAGLVAGVASELTGETLPVVADLETWEGAQAMAEAALARYGRIDVLVNNVGGAIWFKPFTEFAPTEIDAEIRRSLLTTLYSCRAALPSMAARGRGVIVNVSSAATRGIHRIPYSAAKGGINAITASLAFEYADAGIRVVASAPGGTEAPPRRISRGGSALESEQEKTWFQAHIDQTVNSSLLKRYGTLDEQAAAIAFLASDEASYITGTVLPVAGGDPG